MNIKRGFVKLLCVMICFVVIVKFGLRKELRIEARVLWNGVDIVMSRELIFNEILEDIYQKNRVEQFEAQDEMILVVSEEAKDESVNSQEHHSSEKEKEVEKVESTKGKENNVQKQEDVKNDEIESKGPTEVYEEVGSSNEEVQEEKGLENSEVKEDAVLITSYSNVAEESNMLNLINTARGEEGLHPLSYDATLYNAAKIRGVEITQVFSHTRPNGSSWFTVSSMAHGENLCYNNSYDTAVAYNQFYNSNSHKANMLEPEFTKFACNRVVAEGLIYWVQVFGYN